MKVPLSYYAWLREQVNGDDLDHAMFFNILNLNDYIPVHPEDDNRAQDGIYLRTRIMDIYDTPIPGCDYTGPCTFLEFLVALSRRLNDATYDPGHKNQIPDWFWFLVYNLDMGPTEDVHISLTNGSYVLQAMDRYMSNQYAPDGSAGGLFIINNPGIDIRTLPVWDQMQLFLMEYFE